MLEFKVHVTIQNKPDVRDPEGETILNDLVAKRSSSISQIRTAKMLKFIIRHKTATEAEEEVRSICDELRLYNPIVSSIHVTTSG